jgi:hypothetical protein
MRGQGSWRKSLQDSQKALGREILAKTTPALAQNARGSNLESFVQFKGWKSQVIGWMAKGTQVKPLEVVQVGADAWARVDRWKCAAAKYNGVEMIR